MTKAIERKQRRPAPKQVRARERQTKILRAANGLLQTGSVSDVTTTTVALKAAVPVGSVYRYFGDRNDILELLYQQAYDSVEKSLMKSHAQISAENTTDPIRCILGSFWQTAKTHPTFVKLTRWANSHYSLWDVMPGGDSNLAALIEKTLDYSGVRIPAHRKMAANKIMVTATSVLVDLIVEEDDSDTANALLDELAVLLGAYVATFDQTD